MNWLWIVIIVLSALLIQAYTQNKTSPEEPKVTITDYSNCYQKKLLLTKNEWYEYRKLKEQAATLGLIVCPKVRLLDLVEPRKGEKNYKSLFWKIQAKHIDFLICDPDLRIKAIVELDDNSHDRKDRQERDEFVDQVLRSVGYTVIHTRSVTENTLDPIKPKAEPAGEQGSTST